jgi:hypothetical protein
MDAVDQSWKAKPQQAFAGNTATAKGVRADVSIAQEKQIPYFFLQGHKQAGC